MQATPRAHGARDEHRTAATPLSPDELFRFYEDGFLRLGRVVDDSTVDALRASIAAGRADARLESDLLDAAAWPDGEGGVPQEPGRNVSFLFNMWREDARVPAASSPTPRSPAWPPRRSGRRRSACSRTTP